MSFFKIQIYRFFVKFLEKNGKAVIYYKLSDCLFVAI
jgi:hypothetical protein